MSDIKFSKEETEVLVSKVKTYFSEELEHEIGGFEAEFLIDFISKEVGAFFYNRGLADALALFSERAEELNYLVQELEMPTA